VRNPAHRQKAMSGTGDVAASIQSLRRELGRNLRSARTAAGYSQMQLARKIGYARSTVSTVESGCQNPSRQFWQRCENVLGSAGLLRSHDHIRERVTDEKAARIPASLVPGHGPPDVTVTIDRSGDCWRVEIFLPKRPG
jgi:transcriptional regulator with XRE-family HTH domain